MATRSGDGRFTFAVVGRDEARTLPAVLEQAILATGPDDEVWFVDSASRDDSVDVARALGVQVIAGGPGKGRAITAAVKQCRSDYICLLDADLYEWETNVPAALRQEILNTGADMVVATFVSDRRRMITPLLYWPLVDALFPEHGRRCGPTPLSGLRVLARRAVPDGLPVGYGVETYLNLNLGAADAHIGVIDLGVVRDLLRDYANVWAVGEAMITTILEFAVAQHRLTPQQRQILEDWAVARLAIMAGAREGDRAEVPRLVAGHPFPRLDPQQ